jgi:hypothetical protein
MPAIEYHLSLDMAEHLALMERNEIGHDSAHPARHPGGGTQGRALKAAALSRSRPYRPAANRPRFSKIGLFFDGCTAAAP